MDARYGLAELVKRLVVETTEGLVDAEFATAEGTDLGDFDGKVSAEAGSRWVPAGQSVWELSVRRDVGTKADEDYAKRTEAPSGWSMVEVDYVSVSLRDWQKRNGWAGQRSSEGRWRRVRALGLDDVMSWLAEAPQCELWLANRLGLHPEEFVGGTMWWEQRVLKTGGLFDSSITLAGRGGAASELRQRMRDGSRPVVVEAASVEEALDFIAAAGETPEESGDTDSLLGQMVFVSGPNAWQRLLAEQGPKMVLVAMDPSLAQSLSAANKSVVIPVQPQGSPVVARHRRDGTRDCVSVPPLDAKVVAEALDSSEARIRGIDFHQAQRLGDLGRRSASALRRELSVEVAGGAPNWSRNDSSTSLTARQAKTAALLAGEWTSIPIESSSSSNDRNIIAELAGGKTDYETLEIEFNSFATGADPMLDLSGSTWRLVNHPEAWLLLAGSLLTADAIDRFLRTTSAVLGEPDPLGGLEGVERGVAQMRGEGRRHSNQLRRGMARTLVLLCIHGGSLPVLDGGAAARAKHCVGQLLGEDEDDGESVEARVSRLRDLGDVLPLLAEAAPIEFVQAIDRTLRLGPRISEFLFTDTWDDVSVLGLSSPHTALLFAIETLAWLPEHLSDVADILLRLEMLDPDGRLANRPEATFSAIFSAWAPQSGSGNQERLDVLRGLHNRLVESAANNEHMRALVRLLMSLIPEPGSTVTSSSRPEFREYPPPQLGDDQGIVSSYAEVVIELLLSLVTHGVRECRETAGLQEMFEVQAGLMKPLLLPPPARDRLWALVEEAVTVVEPERLNAVGERLSGWPAFKMNAQNPLGRSRRTKPNA